MILSRRKLFQLAAPTIVGIGGLMQLSLPKAFSPLSPVLALVMRANEAWGQVAIRGGRSLSAGPPVVYPPGECAYPMADYIYQRTLEWYASDGYREYRDLLSSLTQ